MCLDYKIITISVLEATIRFLKAKLRVMQEEMDRLCQECSDKVEKERERLGDEAIPSLKSFHCLYDMQ